MTELREREEELFEQAGKLFLLENQLDLKEC